jgi:hypothetical protein
LDRQSKIRLKFFTASVNQGGNLSELFNVERGCRQGVPLFPYLFILCAEVLAIKIKNIGGLKIVNIENKLSQFANDTAIFLNGTEFSLQKSLEELNSFADLSGLNINYTKTQVVWIGSKRFSDEKLCLNLDLTWGKHSFKYLGIDFDIHVDLSRMIKINFEKKIIEIKSLLRQME